MSHTGLSPVHTPHFTSLKDLFLLHSLCCANRLRQMGLALIHSVLDLLCLLEEPAENMALGSAGMTSLANISKRPSIFSG